MVTIMNTDTSNTLEIKKSELREKLDEMVNSCIVVGRYVRLVDPPLLIWFDQVPEGHRDTEGKSG